MGLRHMMILLAVAGCGETVTKTPFEISSGTPIAFERQPVAPVAVPVAVPAGSVGIARETSRGGRHDLGSVDLEAAEIELRELLPVVIRDQLGMGLIMIGDLTKPVSWSSHDDDRDSVRSAIEVAVAGAGYSLSYVDNIAVVSDQSAGNGAGAARGLVRVEKARPEIIAEGVRAAFPSVDIGIAGNAMTFSGLTSDIRPAMNMARALDNDEISAVPWAIVRLPRAVAAEASQLLGTLGLSGDVPVDVFSLDGSGLVFIAGYSQDGVQRAVQLLRAFADRLDVQIVRTMPVTDPEASAAAVSELFSAEIAAGALRLVQLAGQGAISMRGDPDAVRQVIEYLRSTEVDETWISVRAVIAETQRGSSVDRGITVGFSGGALAFNVGAGGSDPAGISDGRRFSVGVTTSNFSAALAWLESDAGTSILATPSLSVRSGGQASLNVGSQVPVLDTQATRVDDVDTVIQTITYRDTGVILGVLPRLLNDGRISVAITQETSNAVANSFSSVDSPVFDTRSLTTEIQVVPGELAVVAGLDTRQRQRDNAGVALQVLPAVFKSESDTRTRLFILISAEIQDQARRGAISDQVVGELREVLNAD